MRVESLFIICVLNGLDEDTLRSSAAGLFFKYSGREGTTSVQLWHFRRGGNSWLKVDHWSKDEIYKGSTLVNSAENMDVINGKLRAAKNQGGKDAGAIIVAHGAVGSLAGSPAPEVAKKVAEKSKAENWPVFRKIVLEVCRSGTVNSKDNSKDPTVAQQFLKAYATGVDTDKSVMIVGYDAAVSVAYSQKNEMPEDAYDDNVDARPEFYGKKYIMKHDILYGGEAVWMSQARTSQVKFTGNKNPAKRAFSYIAIKNKPKPIAVEIALDGWSDRI